MSWIVIFIEIVPLHCRIESVLLSNILLRKPSSSVLSEQVAVSQIVGN